MDRLWQSLRRFWRLDDSIAFLNHGSFGACPIPVLEHQAQLRDLMERNPVRFLIDEFPRRLEIVRGEVASLVSARPQDVVFVNNSTSGVNAVLRSLAFHPGDEILTTNQVYGACRNALDYVCARTGARVVVAEVPFPVAEPKQVVEAIVARASERTRLALIDHVTSVTGLVFPIEQIVRELNLRGIDTLVDGAHALGMVTVDLTRLGAAYYVSNFHKWLCAPKGAAMLWVHPDRQAAIVPGTVSHGYRAESESRFRSLFDWQGTDDPTAWLSVGESIRFLSTLFVGGLGAVQSRNHRVAMAAQSVLSTALDMAPPCPESMVGSMVSFPLSPPRSQTGGSQTLPAAKELYERLVRHGFETLVMPGPSPETLVLRVTAQVYNSPQDYERLGEMLPHLLAR